MGSAAAAVALLFVASAASFLFVDAPGCNVVGHGTNVAQACAGSTASKPSLSCCAGVFEAFQEGGIDCLCHISVSPYMMLTGLGSTFAVPAYTACGGRIRAGDLVCLEEELPPEALSSGSPGSSPPPPLKQEAPLPATHRDDQVVVSDVSVAPWYSRHLTLIIYFVGGGVLLAGLFY